MPHPFRSFHLDAEAASQMRRARHEFISGLETLGIHPITAAAAPNDESAARDCLHQVFTSSDDGVLNALTAPDRPAIVPDLRVQSVRSTPGPRHDDVALPEPDRAGATLVSFVQTSGNVPIFGSAARVTLDATRGILGASAVVAEPPNLSPIAALSAKQALARLAALLGSDVKSLATVNSPRLEYFMDAERETWHLVYHFSRVPVAPPGRAKHSNTHHHGVDASPRSLIDQYDYLVDANDGTLVYHYSSNPRAATIAVAAVHLTECEGVDEIGQPRKFYASPAGTAYEMYDPLRSIRTYDLSYGDITGTFPKHAITSPASKPWAADPGAVSAHFHAMKVQQFFYEVLGRHSIDDKGMELVSVVNCTYGHSNPPKSWRNAVWYNQRMWYGQTSDQPGGPLRSWSQYLDIIGHELTHGVTEHTANLVYRDLSGALNESFSDIFGVIINNWVAVGPDSDVAGWSWEIGKGLNSGKPLRDMADPKALGYPVHMREYVPMTADEGGVHIYSNIHNKAAYELLNAKNADGTRPVSARAGAVLYYMTLQQLGPMSNFSDARVALVDSANVYFGVAADRAAALGAIADAYDSVGIT